MSGIFQAQFVSSRGDSHLIDLNPRMYGSMGLAFAAGHNLPAIWADLLLGQIAAGGPLPRGRALSLGGARPGRLGAAILVGDWRTAVAVLRPRRRTAHALASVTDPVPAAASGRLARMRRLRSRLRH